ncbi:hypothetical protein CCYA_CCYA10G2866 [Cyanidiococcus yangmingshanensis]|nr:hypothetical protein CCYA_CCYA10G2866 [Cyanidiococcus yangmingshanensis]
MVRRRTLWILLASSVAAGLLVHEVVSLEPTSDLYASPAPRQAAPWSRTVLQTLPLRLLSHGVGVLSRIPLPKSLRRPLLSTYCSSMPACHLEEVRDPLETFATLSAFQQRRLKPSARPIDQTASLVAPCDGRLLAIGQVESGALLQPIKGVRLSVRSLLDATDDHDPLVRGPVNVQVAHTERTALASSSSSQTEAWQEARDPTTQSSGLFYAVFHLPAGSYHRFHSPTRWHVLRRRHVVGQLLPGTPRILRRLGSLFALNERVCLFGEWKYGFMGLVAIGAFGNGHIDLHFDDDLLTNRWDDYAPQRHEWTYRWPVSLEPGEEMGGFKLGSCIVLLFEAPLIIDPDRGNAGLAFVAQAGDWVRTGEALVAPRHHG